MDNNTFRVEILININTVKSISFPSLKEIVMEKYLTDITTSHTYNKVKTDVWNKLSAFKNVGIFLHQLFLNGRIRACDAVLMLKRENTLIKNYL